MSVNYTSSTCEHLILLVIVVVSVVAAIRVIEASVVVVRVISVAMIGCHVPIIGESWGETMCSLR